MNFKLDENVYEIKYYGWYGYHYLITIKDIGVTFAVQPLSENGGHGFRVAFHQADMHNSWAVERKSLRAAMGACLREMQKWIVGHRLTKKPWKGGLYPGTIADMEAQKAKYSKEA